MATGQASIDIDQPADAVWAVVSDFGGIGTWMPGIDACPRRGRPAHPRHHGHDHHRGAGVL